MPNVTPTLENFQQHCESLASLYVERRRGFIDLVDACQNYAVAYGVVEAYGQDEVQRIMAAVFARAKVRHDVIDGMTDEQFYDYLNDPERLRQKRGGHAPQATYNAVQYVLRTGGFTALKSNERRITELSERQLKDLIISLDKAGAEPRLLEALARILPDVTGRGRAD